MARCHIPPAGVLFAERWAPAGLTTPNAETAEIADQESTDSSACSACSAFDVVLRRPAELLPGVRPFEACLVPGIRQNLPEKQPQPDLVAPDVAFRCARLDDPRVRDPRRRMTRDIDDTTALEDEVVRHAIDLSHRDDGWESLQ